MSAHAISQLCYIVVMSSDACVLTKGGAAPHGARGTFTCIDGLALWLALGLAVALGLGGQHVAGRVLNRLAAVFDAPKSTVAATGTPPSATP